VQRTSSLEARITGVVETMFATAAPYHDFAGSLFATAASPTSPLNPFSAAFAEVREDGIALFARVIDGCSPRIPADLAEELPFLLWTFNLGLMFCWIHDHSRRHEKSRTILQQSTRLIVRLLRLSSVPGAHYFRRQIITITNVIRSSLVASVAHTT
jgi:hypothetical protein